MAGRSWHGDEWDEAQERAVGAFIGMAVGDALGATVEFMTPSEIRNRYGVHREIRGGGWLNLKPGSVTDDTEMAVAMARAIISSGGWNLKAIADSFVTWLKGRPVDCGDTCRRGIRRYMMEGSLESPPNEWDAGNGALMRILPAVLCAWPDQELISRFVVEQGHITHNHPLSDAACTGIGLLVSHAIRGREKSRLFREAERLVESFPQFRFSPYPGLASGYVVDTVQTVLFHFFAGKSFEECLVRTVNQGGDADTTGALCGMLAGAYYGPDAIPSRWLKKMGRPLLSGLAECARTLLAMGRSLHTT